MNVRPLLALFALVSITACHRRAFEDRVAREETIVTSTTVITSADAPAETAQETPAPAAASPLPVQAPPSTAAPAPPSATVAEPLPEAPSGADRIARNLGMGDAGASTTAAPPAPPAERAPEPPPYRAPSAADPYPWAGDTYVPNP